MEIGTRGYGYGERSTSDVFGDSPQSNNDSFMIKYGDVVTAPEVPELQEITVKNELKEYKITTEILENSDGEKVGGITSGTEIEGSNLKLVEEVKHGYDGLQEITITPDINYSIYNIKINDEDYDFVPDDNGVVTIPLFEDVQEDKNIEVTFEKNLSSVLVHHYLKDKDANYTETSLAADEYYTKKIGNSYATLPKVDISGFELEKEDDGNYKIPSNASGTYKATQTVVSYYYEEIPYTLTVHHYLEGTENSLAEDEVYTKYKNESYETSPSDEVLKKYNVLEELTTVTPEGAETTGTIQEDTEVTYYYQPKQYNITTEVANHAETDVTGTTTEYKGGTISGEGEENYETVLYGENSQKDIVITADEGYQIHSIRIENISEDGTKEEENVTIDKNLKTYTLNKFNNMKTHKNVIAEFEKTQGLVKVHHYLEGTTTQVPSKTGGAVEDEIKTGSIGSAFATKPSGDAVEYYESTSSTEPTSGTYKKEMQEVTYYYSLKDYEYTVEYYYEGILDDNKTDHFTATYGAKIESYAEKDEEGYIFSRTENYPLTITSNETENVIRVHYILDDANTKALSYTVEYYKENAHEKDNDQKETEVVQLLAPNILTVNQEKINIVDKYEGYKFDKMTVNDEEVDSLPETVEDKTVIKVYYLRKDAKVIVHHYYENTTKKIADDVEIKGKVNIEYATEVSDEIPANYTCVNKKPTGYTGRMTEDTIEVTYYYYLNTPIVNDEITKTATANEEKEYKVSDEETKTYAVLTKEDGEVVYEIKYKVKIDDYIGNADVEIIDKLPAAINETKSDLANGTYDALTNTITWTEKIEDIDTYESEESYEVEITKTIKIVYSGQDLTRDVVNNVSGKINLYYPEDDPQNDGTPQLEEKTEIDVGVKQEYTVELKIEKQWNDDEQTEKRPESITINVKSEPGNMDEDYILNLDNNWSYTVKGLNKYTEDGEKITYKLTEKETNSGDLKNYDFVDITMNENQTAQKTTYKYTVENDYNPVIDMDATMTKQGTNEIADSEQLIEYAINFKAKVKGDAILKIVDTLPYKIDEEESDLAEGIYDEETLTITWKEELSRENEETYDLDMIKEISLKYKDVDLTKDKMTNYVSGEIELTEFKGRDKATATFDTEINVEGKVKVRYVNKETGKDFTYIDKNDEGKDIEKTYNYEITGKVGKDYTTKLVEIKNYQCVDSTDNKNGKITEEEQEVIYYYELKDAKVIVKYLDENGKEVSEDDIIKGKVGDEYKTEPKEIEGCELVETPENAKGTMTEETITVTYGYKRKDAKVIVKYLDENSEKLSEDEAIKGKVGDSYKVEARKINGYEPIKIPENAEGTMTEETITVTYVYKKKEAEVIVKYVDEYEKEISEDEIIKGKMGDKYETKVKEIEGYELIEIPSNAKGTMTEETITVKYSYKKKTTQETLASTTPQSTTDSQSTPTQQTIAISETPTSTTTIIPSTSNISSVYTGDNEHIEIYVVIVGMAAVYLLGLIVIVIIKKHNK